MERKNEGLNVFRLTQELRLFPLARRCLLKRVELVLAEKGANEKLRIEGERSSMERRFFDVIKMKLQKKRVIVDAAREVGFSPLVVPDEALTNV